MGGAHAGAPPHFLSGRLLIRLLFNLIVYLKLLAVGGMVVTIILSPLFILSPAIARGILILLAVVLIPVSIRFADAVAKDDSGTFKIGESNAIERKRPRDSQ